jgi:MFS family permease
VALPFVFCVIETKVAEPMFRLRLFRIRAFSAGVTASLLAATSRGGLMFMLIIWLQGIWLPLHGYTFSRTPLRAGIAILPLTAGFLIAGPLSGILSDHLGARPFATGGMIGTVVGFALMELLPVDFPYWVFALLLTFIGLSMACFGSPNRAGVMNSLPAEYRGVGAGMNNTFTNSGQVLSIGVFFTLMIVGPSGSLPSSLYLGLVAHGIPTTSAQRISTLSPVSTLFASLLGYNPVQQLLGPHVLATLPHPQAMTLTSRSLFPSLIARPFRSGLHAALDFAIIASLLAAAASWTRGGKGAPGHAELGDSPGLENTSENVDQRERLKVGTVNEPAGAGIGSHAAIRTKTLG